MKRFFAAFVFLFIFVNLNAQGYKIEKVNYELKPSSWDFLAVTSEYAISQAVPVDYNKIFETKEDVELYSEDLETRLKNTRAFASVQVLLVYGKPSSKDSYTPVTLNVTTEDSIHILAVPYPKYDSNDGFLFKLKIKDTNFLGTMNTMNSELNFHVDTSGAETKYKIGLQFDFDYPFKAGIFDAVFVNDYSLDYTFGEHTPEFSTKTGLKFTLPKKNHSYVFEVYQKIINNFDYNIYDDNFYFNNNIAFSVPFKLASFKRYGDLNYSPSLSFNVNYDKDGINQLNSDLLGPAITFSHSLSVGRINWKNDMRSGLSASISNAYEYNFSKDRLFPSLSLEGKFFSNIKYTDKIDFLDRIGFCADLYTYFLFTGIESNPFISTDGTNFGDRLRGIRDTQYFENGWEAVKSIGVITLNLDFPFHLFTTNFTGRIMSYFNFDCQISPFIDIGLSYNKVTKEWFNPKDGYYAAGFEVLVYPVKWSSFTVRGSLGIDIGRKLLSKYLNTDWRANPSSYEIFFGIGLHY
jgi:hypothetical protein